jgi:hypothetical protein
VLHNFRISESVSIRTESGRVVAFDEATDSAHLVDGPALEVLELVGSGDEPATPEQREALELLIVLGVVVPADKSELSRRRVVTYAGGAALGVVSLLLPASQVAASYQGYGDVLSSGVLGTADSLSPFASSVRLPIPSSPSRPTAVRFTIEGAAGADSTVDYPRDGGSGTYRLGDAGRGAVVQATFQLSAIDALLTSAVPYFTCYVGRRGGPVGAKPFGQGTYSTTSASYNVGTNMGGPHATFWGGYASNGNIDGGGGGAATLIYPGVAGFGSGDRILMVAGGGGGGGAGTQVSFGTASPQPGGAGGNAGRNGRQGGSTTGTSTPGTGGGGGTTSGDGGSVGAAGTGGGGGATAGSMGQGGIGGFSGGAGGGGWRGGGGGVAASNGFGGSGAGGGGGSSWIRDAVATSQAYSTATVARGGSVAVEWFFPA